MKPEDVYRLQPEAISDEMIEAGRTLIESGEVKWIDIANLMLEVAQDYYRRGAFDMEHREGKICQAEDQGGHPCCSRPAEFYIMKMFLEKGEKSPVYCSTHRAFNRFYRPDQMIPIYENPSG